jgi:hypothetical protein
MYKMAFDYRSAIMNNQVPGPSGTDRAGDLFPALFFKQFKISPAVR